MTDMTVNEAFVLEIDVDGQGVAYLDIVGCPHPTPDGAVQFARRVDAETYLENGKDLWRLAGIAPYVATLARPASAPDTERWPNEAGFAALSEARVDYAPHAASAPEGVVEAVERLRDRLARHKQRDLACAMGVTEARVSQLLGEHTNWTLKTILSLERADKALSASAPEGRI